MLVAVVSVGGGGFGGGAVSVPVDGGVAVFVLLSIGGIDGGGSTRGRGRGGGLYPPIDPPVVVGSDPAMVPGGAVDVVMAVSGRVNAVVVSTLVVVADVVIGTAVSVGAVSVALPLVEPSWTTS